MTGSYGPDLDPSEADYDPQTDAFVDARIAKERRYQHFDRQLTQAEREAPYRLDATNVNHAFAPLLGFEQIKRKVRRDKATEALVVKRKPRRIRYASHRDARHLSAYAARLSFAYEKRIELESLGPSVLAYRATGSTNIDHAKSLFDEIAAVGDCTVLALDISAFFDRLDHRYLRRMVKEVLGVTRLEDHDWNVFRNVTRYSWVDLKMLRLWLGPAKERRGTVCTKAEYHRWISRGGRQSGLVQMNDGGAGIPQGTPVSGLYANLYLLHVDLALRAWAADRGGSYRRYSDDIAILLPGRVDRHDVEAEVARHLGTAHLQLSEDKTEVATFVGGKAMDGHPIQYLGFTYDGDRTLIRMSSIHAYRMKIRRGIHSKMMATRAKLRRLDQPFDPKKLHRKKLKATYTSLGGGRNFYRYAERASKTLGAPEILRQLRRHDRWFAKDFAAAVARCS
ncbi:MAG: antiviral reverse transcriptase Drt2 [Shimia sp.]